MNSVDNLLSMDSTDSQSRQCDDELSVDEFDFNSIPWNNWCRLCAKEDFQQCNEFEDQGQEISECMQDLSSNTALAEAIEKFFNVKFYKDSFIPKYLCRDCLFVVSNTITFNEHVQKVQNMYYHQIDTLDSVDLKKLRFEFNVVDTETKSIFSDYSKGVISFKHLLVNKEKKIADNELELVEILSDSMVSEQNEIDKDIASMDPLCNKDETDIFIEKSQTPPTRRLLILEGVLETPIDLTCKECNHHIGTYQLYEDHLRKSHLNLLKETQHKCLQCEQYFNDIVQLKKHFKDLHQPDVPRYKCKDCPKYYNSLGGLVSHMKSEHGIEKPFECKECGLRSSNETNLRNHMAKHSGVKPFECADCNVKFWTNTKLKVHIKESHSGGQSICSICGKDCRSTKALTKHLFVHSDATMECEICGIKFKHKRNYRRHLIMHTNLKLFPCVICEKTLATATSRRTHMKMYHPEELKAYDAKGGIPRVQLPSDEVLKSMYINSSSKTRPQKKILLEEKQVCHICGKDFKAIHKLKLHLLLHSSNKRHQCEICGKKFHLTTALRRHCISHTNLKLFPCEFCDKIFSYPSPCYTHMKKIHPNELKASTELGLKLQRKLPTMEELRAAYIVKEL